MTAVKTCRRGEELTVKSSLVSVELVPEDYSSMGTSGWSDCVRRATAAGVIMRGGTASEAWISLPEWRSQPEQGVSRSGNNQTTPSSSTMATYTAPDDNDNGYNAAVAPAPKTPSLQSVASYGRFDPIFQTFYAIQNSRPHDIIHPNAFTQTLETMYPTAANLAGFGSVASYIEAAKQIGAIVHMRESWGDSFELGTPGLSSVTHSPPLVNAAPVDGIKYVETSTLDLTNRFQPLIKTIKEIRASLPGKPVRIPRTMVGNKLGSKDYRAMGVSTFKECVEAAQQANLVDKGGDPNFNWVSLKEWVEPPTASSTQTESYRRLQVLRSAITKARASLPGSPLQISRTLVGDILAKEDFKAAGLSAFKLRDCIEEAQAAGLLRKGDDTQLIVLTERMVQSVPNHRRVESIPTPRTPAISLSATSPDRFQKFFQVLDRRGGESGRVLCSLMGLSITADDYRAMQVSGFADCIGQVEQTGLVSRGGVGGGAWVSRKQ